MKYRIIVLTLSGLLAACSQTPTERLDSLVTPAIKNYPKSVREKAAAEIKSGSCPALNDFAIDYGVMRDQSRAARGEKVNVAR